MPKYRPATSGYARIAQEEEETGPVLADETDVDDPYARPTTISDAAPRYAPIQPRPHGPLYAPDLPSITQHRRPTGRRQRMRSNSSGVDIKAINARLERWAEEIASKFKRGKIKGSRLEESPLEIHHSVFQPPEGIRPVTADTVDSEPGASARGRTTKQEFEDIIESVRVAIEMAIHPKMISQGSSGSYFARNTDGRVVGVFKPKDEEPYASRNPKWTKWIHRNLFPCFFGRACLIPNLSYVSEAAAYVLDTRLRTNLVPYTDIVYLSSKSFHYDFWDRANFYRKRNPLPLKVGSFQVFLQGYRDANIFLREHPWPDQHNPGFRTDAAPKTKRMPWNETCRPRGAASNHEAETDDETDANEEAARQRRFFWTDALRQSFREELEKLVILDYIMRNTDRGLDNWMIRIDQQSETASIVSEPATKLKLDADHAPLSPPPLDVPSPNPYKRQTPMAAAHDAVADPGRGRPSISIGAIDNSLSWPWKHPDAWRSFPFGWLFLPVSLIGQPFSKRTRDHFLPLLTSTKWWTDTQVALRGVFSQDSDFKERMFAKQIAVMKGQAWNVVETLKIADHGPLELTRRARVCVWDDLVDIPIAVPLRAPSAEARRRRDEALHQGRDSEEMDISAANDPASLPPDDLLGLSTPSAELPNPNRFVVPRTNGVAKGRSSRDEGRAQSSTSPVTVNGIDLEERDDGGERATSRMEASTPSLRPLTKWKTRSSLDESAYRRHGISGTKRRRYSFVGRRGSNNTLYGDDLEGDLGYAAAEGMEKHHRKVIMERLETVKRNPVFTCC